jgi:hypothetical protein
MRRKSLIAFGLFGVGLAVGLGLATVGSYAATYLTKVGPPALRFQPPRVISSPLPPLPKEEKAIVEDTHQAAVFEFTPTLTLMTDVVLSVLADKGLINEPSTNSMLQQQAEVFSAFSFAAPRPHEIAISPQMFVDFFRPAAGFTNAGGMGVSVPVEFLPATPTPPASSSATYRSQ